MTLPVSGAISFNNINVELGVSGTTQASLGQTSYRNLAGVASGAISMSDFYGKANQFAFTISSNQTNANLRTLALAAGWNSASRVVATINSGVVISSNNTGTPALSVADSFPGGVELINNGIIVGMGGAGGSAGSAASRYSPPGPASSGSVGGTALAAFVAVTINNAGTIAGGGGGGGGGQTRYGADEYSNYFMSGGGGGGGGRSSNAANSAAGAGFVTNSDFYGAVGGNSGSAGTYSAAGSGGAGRNNQNNSGFPAGAGGAGGGWGSAGSSGATAGPGGSGNSVGSGGSAGAAVSGNSNITWSATGTRLGPIT